MRRSFSKIRHINQTNILLENRYLVEQGGDSVNNLLSKLPKAQKDEISATLAKEIEKHPKGGEVKKHLDLHLPMGGHSHGNESLLNKILHKAHPHIDLVKNELKFKIGEVEIELPLPGNIAQTILSGGHHDSHGGGHQFVGPGAPHPEFGVGVKVPINWGRK